MKRNQEFNPRLYTMDILVRGLSATDRFGKKVLDIFELDIPQGTHATITGPNGSGKSTLITAMAGIPADKESLSYEGSVAYQMRSKTSYIHEELLPWDYPIKRQNMGFVTQTPLFDKDMPVHDHITLDAGMKGLIPARKDRKARRQKMDKIDRVSKMLGIYDMHRLTMGELSGGQRARVMIAAALATDPNVLLMDEPTSDLDVESKHEVNASVGRLVRGLGITAVMVTHDPLYAPRQIHMVDGKIVSDVTRQRPAAGIIRTGLSPDRDPRGFRGQPQSRMPRRP